MSDFDLEIERELDRVLRPIAAAPVPAWRAPAPARAVKKVVGGASAAIVAKLATGFVVAALATAGATEAAITGSLNPADWGQQVKQQVSSCKAALPPGDHGIGACVSSFAAQRGAARNGAGQGNSNSNGTGKPKHSDNHGQGQPANKSHEHPPWDRD